MRRNSLNLAAIEEASRTGEWDALPERLRSRYTQILRSICHSNSGALPATRLRAKRILEAHGLKKRNDAPFRKASTPDPVQREHQEARFNGLVRMQRKRLMEEMKAAPVVQIDGGSASRVQAAEDLVRIKDAVLISDEMVRYRRGRTPIGQIKRRERRVIRIALAFTPSEDRI